MGWPGNVYQMSNLSRIQRSQGANYTILRDSSLSKGNGICKHSESEKNLQIKETEIGSCMWAENIERITVYDEGGTKLLTL